MAVAGAAMTKVQFLDIKPFVSCCKDLEIVFYIPSSIKASNKHYIALCELLESSHFTWVWAGKTEPLEQEGITVKWRQGKVTFTNQVLPKLSDGREYYLMYCNEDGTILGESRPFQFSTESNEFSSIDLQSTPSDDVIMISMHGKKAPPTREVQFTDDTTSFEVISEQTYSDTEPTVEKGETDYFSQSVTSTVVPKNLKSTTTIERTDLKDDDKLLTSSYTETKHCHNLPMESTSNPEDIQLLKSEVVSMKAEVTRLKDEVTRKENVIEELQSENATLKEQIALHTLSNSTLLVNSPKEDKEKNLKRRMQDEAKKSAIPEEKKDKQLQSKANLIREKIQSLSQNLSLLQVKIMELNDQLEEFYTQPNSVEQGETALAGQGTNREKDILIKHYSDIHNIVRDSKEIAPYCVSEKIITPQDDRDIHNTEDPSKQVNILLHRIIGPVQAGNPQGFYRLLDIMEQHGLKPTQQLATEIKQSLNIESSCMGDDELVQLSKQLQLYDKQHRQLHSILEQGDQEKTNDIMRRLKHDMQQLLRETSYEAMYPYEAKQVDEVSLIEGDIITFSCFSDYDGWMVGCVERTGVNGLFPLNHVKRIT